MAQQLLQVKDPGPALQAQADKLVPLGWCSVCVGGAKQAMKDGGTPDAIHAAVIEVPRGQMVNIPGVGVTPAVLPAGVCWEHLAATPASGLLQA